MSNKVNTDLFEQANEVMEYFTNTVLERIIERDIKANDLEALKKHVEEGYAQMKMEYDADLTSFLGANDVY